MYKYCAKCFRLGIQGLSLGNICSQRSVRTYWPWILHSNVWVQPQKGKLVSDKLAFPWNFQAITTSSVNSFALHCFNITNCSLLCATVVTNLQACLFPYSYFVPHLILVRDKPLLSGHLPAPARGWPLDRGSIVVTFMQNRGGSWTFVPLKSSENTSPFKTHTAIKPGTFWCQAKRPKHNKKSRRVLQWETSV